MATRYRKPSLSSRLRDSLARSVELTSNLRMSNIPKDCIESAAASWLSVNRKPACWVILNLRTGKAKSYDLRFGREAKEKGA